MLSSVLIVEDDVDCATVFADGLRTFATPIIAPNAEEALRILETSPIDVVLLDVGLPRTSGIELCRLIRARLGHWLPRVVFVSGTERVAERVSAFDAGADDFISKPVSREELCAKVRRNAEVAGRLRASCPECERTRPLVGLGERTAQLAHDVRNPLAVVTGVTSILQKIYPNEPRLAKLSKAAWSAATMLDESLSPLRPSSQTSFSVDDIVRTEVDFATERSSPGSFELQLDLGALPQIIGRASVFARILSNLIRNAIEAMDGCPKRILAIKTRFDHEAKVVRLSLSDTGRGIEPSVAQRLLSRQQVTTKMGSIHGGSGTGLGMPSVRSFVDEAGGFLSCTSSGSEGTTFHVVIPVKVA